MNDPVLVKMLELLEDPKYRWDFSVPIYQETELYRIYRLTSGKKLTVFIATLDKQGNIVDDYKHVVIEE